MANKRDFTGRIIDEDGNVIYEKVIGYYQSDPDEEYSDWSGRLTVESCDKPHMFDDAVLETDIGERWTIFSTGFDPASGVFEVAGNGPAREES